MYSLPLAVEMGGAFLQTCEIHSQARSERKARRHPDSKILDSVFKKLMPPQFPHPLKGNLLNNNTNAKIKKVPGF